MNKENIDLIQQKYPGWFEDYVSCNLYHDPTTDQMNQYTVFTVKFFPLLKPLGVPEIIQSNLTSNSEHFIDHVNYQIENFINSVCEKALK